MSKEPTPGPWSARSTGTEIVIYHPYEGGKHRIAKVNDCRYWDVNAQGCGSKSPMANARLIAAAPTLRDALNNILCTALDENLEDVEVREFAQEHARNALEAAEVNP